jgi:hypothetical protein
MKCCPAKFQWRHIYAAGGLHKLYLEFTIAFLKLRKKPVVTCRKAGENLPESKAKEYEYARRTTHI